VKFAGSRSLLRCVRLAPVFRVTALVSVAAALTCALLLREARAQLDGAMHGLGSTVMAFPEAPSIEVRTLRINGVEVNLRTEVVEASLPSVLHHYRGVCSSAGSGGGDYGSIVAALATRSGSTDRDGYIACVATRVGDLGTLVERLVRFAQTWNLAEVGPLRYAYASRSADRPEDQTFLLTMWADASLDLHDLLPIGQDDAKGADPEGVPRPPRARRILSATEDSAPSGVFVYLAEVAPAVELMRAYRSALLAAAWNILERSPGESLELSGVRILSAEKDGRTLSMLAHAGDSDATVVSLLVSEAE